MTPRVRAADLYLLGWDAGVRGENVDQTSPGAMRDGNAAGLLARKDAHCCALDWIDVNDPGAGR